MWCRRDWGRLVRLLCLVLENWWGPDVVLQGNLDPGYLLGTPEALDAATDRLSLLLGMGSVTSLT